MFIFQSFISTNVRQCFCPPSIDPQREREREGGGGGRGKAVTGNKGESREKQWEDWEVRGGSRGEVRGEREDKI